MSTSRERKNDSRGFNRLMDRAYLMDGKSLHTGEALLLATLLHSQGAGRNSDDMKDLQRIMQDPNAE